MQTEKMPFMNTKQTAVYLGIHRVTLYRWIKEKRVPFTRFGGRGRIYFLKEQLDSFMLTKGII